MVPTALQPIRVVDLIKMLAEILGLSAEVEVVDEEYPGHYVRAPYAYLPKQELTYSRQLHVELGQGLLPLIDDFRREMEAAEFLR
jgi:UDP-glucose 4-epimerase